MLENERWWETKSSHLAHRRLLYLWHKRTSPYGDTPIVSSSVGRGPTLFVKVNVFTLKKCPPVVSNAVSGEMCIVRKTERAQKQHFPQYKRMAIIHVECWNVLPADLPCVPHWDTAGVNSIFSLLNKVASRWEEWLRGCEVIRHTGVKRSTCQRLRHKIHTLKYFYILALCFYWLHPSYDIPPGLLQVVWRMTRK